LARAKFIGCCCFGFEAANSLDIKPNHFMPGFSGQSSILLSPNGLVAFTSFSVAITDV
jgi:hypothetical protein